jgi:hypothetical protein
MLKILRATVAAIVAVTLILVTASYAPLALGWAALLSLAWRSGAPPTVLSTAGRPRRRP